LVIWSGKHLCFSAPFPTQTRERMLNGRHSCSGWIGTTHESLPVLLTKLFSPASAGLTKLFCAAASVSSQWRHRDQGRSDRSGFRVTRCANPRMNFKDAHLGQATTCAEFSVRYSSFSPSSCWAPRYFSRRQAFHAQCAFERSRASRSLLAATTLSGRSPHGAAYVGHRSRYSAGSLLNPLSSSRFYRDA